MENMHEAQLTPRLPFSLRFAHPVHPLREDETGGAETETETGRDGIVKKDSEEDADVDE